MTLTNIERARRFKSLQTYRIHEHVLFEELYELMDKKSKLMKDEDYELIEDQNILIKNIEDTLVEAHSVFNMGRYIIFSCYDMFGYKERQTKNTLTFRGPVNKAYAALDYNKNTAIIDKAYRDAKNEIKGFLE